MLRLAAWLVVSTATWLVLSTLIRSVASARKLLADAKVDFKEHISVGQPGPAILAFAKRLNCGQIVMGTHGAGAALQLVLGSVAQDVVRESKVPVTVVK